MKKILLLLPIVLICTSCTKEPKELDIKSTSIIEESPINTDTSIPTLSPESISGNEPTISSSPEVTSDNMPTISPSTKTTSETITSPLPSPSELPKETITSPSPEIIPEKQYESGIEIGNMALDFSTKTLSGTDIKLSDYKGKTVLLNFWATWCGPCVRELPSIQKIHENYSDVVILAVNCGEEVSDVQNFMDKNNYTFNVLSDESGIISHLYFADYIPLTLVIDKNGIITERHIGSLTEDEMLNLIDKGE